MKLQKAKVKTSKKPVIKEYSFLSSYEKRAIKKVNMLKFAKCHRSNAYINKLIRKFDELHDSSTRTEHKSSSDIYEDFDLSTFWCKEGRKYIACFNTSGDCFIEEFFTKEACALYLLSKLGLEEINQIDIKLSSH